MRVNYIIITRLNICPFRFHFMCWRDNILSDILESFHILEGEIPSEYLFDGFHLRKGGDPFSRLGSGERVVSHYLAISAARSSGVAGIYWVLNQSCRTWMESL